MNLSRPLAAARLLPLLLAACTTAARIDVPTALAAAADEQPVLTVSATGVQIYQCRTDASGAPAWAFVAPEAELFDHRGRSVGTHGAGPHWTAHDGSRVVGKLRARADAPRADAIPWLLLDATANAAPGAFGGVTSIQRLRTTGGVAPAGGCRADTAGATARVPYTADYVLFSARRL